MTFDGKQPLMEADLWWKKYNLNNEDDLKNKEDLHVAWRYTVLGILRIAVFLKYEE